MDWLNVPLRGELSLPNSQVLNLGLYARDILQGSRWHLLCYIHRYELWTCASSIRGHTIVQSCLNYIEKYVPFPFLFIYMSFYRECLDMNLLLAKPHIYTLLHNISDCPQCWLLVIIYFLKFSHPLPKLLMRWSLGNIQTIRFIDHDQPNFLGFIGLSLLKWDIVVIIHSHDEEESIYKTNLEMVVKHAGQCNISRSNFAPTNVT